MKTMTFHWYSRILYSIIIENVAMAVTWNVEEHPSWNVVDQFDCGESAADRIIGGYNAALGQFPWIVRLGYTAHTWIIMSNTYLEDDELDWMCGGTLVTDRHVITAAHCIPDPDVGYFLTSIRMGEHDARTDPDCQLGVCAPRVQDRKVKTIKKHENFNKPPFHNDIAIITLTEPVELSDYVAPVCLPRSEEQLAELKIDDMVTVAGWGKLNMTTEERASVLQVVDVPVVRPQMCDSFGKGFNVSASEICAGAQHNKDACGGDSGGPLMKVFDTPEGPKNFLIGVVSFGPTICGIKKPGVYVSVSSFLKWILDNIM